MKIKSPLAIAALIMAGMFATGCQQMSQQQTAAPATTTTPATATTTPAAGGCDPKADKSCHTHPPVPACTNSITHSHQFTDPSHTHHYSCKPGIPHKGTGPVIPKVKAKGNFKGPVKMNQTSQDALKQYQQK